MSISVPYYLFMRLSNEIYDATGASWSQAVGITRTIEQIAIEAAYSGLEIGQAHTYSVESRIYSNIAGDLSLVMDYSDRQIDIIKDGLTDSILILQTQIDQMTGGVSDVVVEELDKSYKAIAETHGVVGTLIDLSLASVGAQVSGTYEKVGEWIHDGFEGALAAVNSTIDHILIGINNYVQSALNVLIPAEARAWIESVGTVLADDPIRSLMRYTGDIFKDKLDAVLTIDEEELKTWIAKGSELVQGLAMQTAKPEGAA